MFFFRPKRITDNSWKIYKTKAHARVQEIIHNLSNKHTFEYNRITIRNQKTRWGSCSSKKNLNFNYKILFLPHELAEYLVVHELCHLKELNHSRKYWQLVEEILPKHKLLRKRLKNIDLKKFGKL